MSPCTRLNEIEKNLDEYPPDHVEDVIWMIWQMRNWQLFAKRVIDFGDELPSEDLVMREKYERIFNVAYGKSPNHSR
jgi:hypothetical protein